MKHLKTFESYSVNEEEGKFRKFFTGHETSDEREDKKKAFFDDLFKYEKEAEEDEDIVFDRKHLEARAKENNYKGHIEARESARDGRTHIMYVPGRSGLEKLGSLAAHKRDNPLN